MATHEVTERSVGERMEMTGTRLTGRRSETKWAPLTTEFWAMVGVIVATLKDPEGNLIQLIQFQES